MEEEFRRANKYTASSTTGDSKVVENAEWKDCGVDVDNIWGDIASRRSISRSRLNYIGMSENAAIEMIITTEFDDSDNNYTLLLRAMSAVIWCGEPRRPFD